MKHRSLSVVLALVFAGVFAAPRLASADPKTVKAIERKNREAMENYDLLDYEAAKKGLNEALALAKRKRLNSHPIKAQTHLYLGIVEFSGFGDKESALLQLMDAVTIDANVEIPAAYRTNELEEMLKSAQREIGGGKGGGGGGGGEPADSVDCGSLMGMSHELVDEAKAGADRKIDAHVAGDVGASKVSLFYRKQGEDSFTEIKMTKSGECRYAAVIPGDALAGEFMHYYVAALNKSDKVVASKGSAGSPNIIEIATGGGGGGGFDEGGGGFDDENPLAGGRKKKKSSGGKSTGSGGKVGGSVSVGPKESKFFLSLALGSGGGYVTGSTESTGNDVGCCFAPALLHVFPELGYMLDKRSSVSLAVRVGFPIGANIEGHSKGAPAALLRYRRAMNPNGRGVALNMGVGGGVIRNTVKLTDPVEEGMDTDTVALGPLLVSAGASYLSDLGGPMRFVFEVNAIAGIPVVEEFSCADPDDSSTCVRPEFGVNFDINLGLLFAF